MAKDYTASTTANVIWTAGDATLSVADPRAWPPATSSTARSRSPGAAGARERRGVRAGRRLVEPDALLTYSNPVSNDPVTIGFKQPIGANDPLRTGSYSKTLTFTLSTTTP